MNTINKAGHVCYGIGVMAYGIQQIVIRDFRPQIVPGFPAWVHQYSIFAIVTGVIMIITGLVIAGILKVQEAIEKKVLFYAGFYFLALIFVSHIPYLLFVYPHKLSHLGSWGDLLKELAFSGGAFVMLGSYAENGAGYYYRNDLPDRFGEKLPVMGRIFFCTTIILFGCNHFAYDISTMVPKWFGMPVFWSYFAGAALIGAGTAILLNIFLKPVSSLLALMLFLWFVVLHVPNALANPSAGRGNPVVSAFDALLFCGVALVLSQTNRTTEATFKTVL